MWTISGFGDEIADDLVEQLDALQALGIQRLDLRAAWGRNVLDLSDEDIATIAAELAQRGMQVTCVASPIGKAPVHGDFEQQLNALRRATAVAQALGSPYVRIFSYYIPDEDEPATYRDEVLDRMGRMAGFAERSGITILHENERGIFGDSPERCHDLLSQIASPAFRAVWEPGNFVSAGFPPHPHAFELLRPWVEYVHVKDTDLATRRIVVAGSGDADWPATIEGLIDTGYEGNFALEPHLQTAGAASGFSGPELFGEAAAALRALFDARGVVCE
jgi:sugar phosphate isomerase/epimerase